MIRAHLSVVSLAERDNDTAGDKIDNLNADKYQVSNQRCMYQEQQRRQRQAVNAGRLRPAVQRSLIKWWIWGT